MDKLVIQGGRQLKGEVVISGAKNAALPILISSILTSGQNVFKNIPDLLDIKTCGELLKHLGLKFEHQNKICFLDASKINNFEVPYELVKTMRASILVLGPLLARCKKARVSLPGGCAIGARPVNLHLAGLEKMGARLRIRQGYIEAEAKKLKGTSFYFEPSTVTGTENLMMAATLAEGASILENAACEPEVIDLANVLNSMGARISGAGTRRVVIEGVEGLRATEYQIMSDRIEAGTYMIAAAVTKGEIDIIGANASYLGALISKLKEAGVRVETKGERIEVKGSAEIKGVNIQTESFPGFPTDMQAQFMVLMLLANSPSIIVENIFENRFQHIGELRRMGAVIEVQGKQAIINGAKTKLSGAPVMATDLRASASLILGGLVAEGMTEISRIYHLDRGYERIEEKLRGLGARIERIHK